MLPSGRGQLLVNLHADELRTYDADGRAVVARTRGAAIAGPSKTSVGIDTAEQRCIVGVSFRPGGAWPLMRVPVDALGAREVELEHVWGRAGEVVHERLLEAGHLGGPEATLAGLGAILVEQVARSPGADRAVAYAVAALERGGTVRDVAQAAGLSERTLLRRFESRVGLGPKRYARIRRLQRVLEAIEGGGNIDWARLAQDCGFADQAHLIGDFRELVGMTPTSYRPALPGMRNHVAYDRFLQSGSLRTRHARAMTKTSIPPATQTASKPATTAATPAPKKTPLTPRLIVKDAPRAIAWYVEHLGARDIVRYATKDGTIVHAEIEVAGALVYLVEESRGWHNHAPPSLGGSPVLLALDVEDVDGFAASMVAGGATVIFPIADQFYGERGGRLQDPFGHVWLISKVIEHLTPEEMQRRMDSFEG